MVWRKPDIGPGNYVGPGLLVANNNKKATCYVDMCGKFWKCSREQVRRATHEEQLAVELSRVFVEERRKFMRQGQTLKAYDVSGEDCTGALLPPVAEETQEDLDDERMPELVPDDDEEPTATEALEQPGLNDYVDHDVDF